MAATTNTSPPPTQQPASRPFIRMSDVEGEPLAEETVVFIRSFGPWNAGVSAGFPTPRARWLYKHRVARPLDPRTDRAGFETMIRK